jgi:hypothetical protein
MGLLFLCQWVGIEKLEPLLFISDFKALRFLVHNLLC